MLAGRLSLRILSQPSLKSSGRSVVTVKAILKQLTSDRHASQLAGPLEARVLTARKRAG